MKRMKTGIPGLDAMLAGGFPIPSIIFIAGEPGTGKSTFGIQSAFYGASNGERSLYITGISEPISTMKMFMSEFSFYDQKPIDEKRIVFIDIGETIKKQPYYILNILKRAIDAHNPTRIIIDPISVVAIAIRNTKLFREFMHDFIIYVKGYERVTMIIGESPYSSIASEMISYLVDGVVILSYLEEEDVKRKYIEVLKMRGTRHLPGKHFVDVSKDGITVQPGLR